VTLDKVLVDLTNALFLIIDFVTITVVGLVFIVLKVGFGGAKFVGLCLVDVRELLVGEYNINEGIV